MLLPYAGHPWVQVDGVAPDKPLDSAVLTRLKQFSAMDKLKKIAIRVRKFSPIMTELRLYVDTDHYSTVYIPYTKSLYTVST